MLLRMLSSWGSLKDHWQAEASALSPQDRRSPLASVASRHFLGHTASGARMNKYPSLDQEPPSQLPGPRGPVDVHAVLLLEGAWVVDNGALHGRAGVERGIRFTENPRSSGLGICLKVVWLAVDPQPGRSPYVGVVAGDFWLDAASGTGFKSLAAHTNGICASAAGKVDLTLLTKPERDSLRAFLEHRAPASWSATESRLKLFLMA
jgi:hypothetical protein